MRIATRFFSTLAVLALMTTPGMARAAAISIDWLTMSPPAVGTSVPNNSVYNVAGIGNVTVSYVLPTNFTDARSVSPLYTAGNVVFGPDTYSWTDFEYFGTTFTDGDLGPLFYTITFTFPALLSPGTVYVGVIGLGATTSFGGGASSAACFQNGTFLGDYVGDATAGATQVNDLVGFFGMQNSVTGAGGVNPHWNTHLGVVRIDDAVTSVTLTMGNLRGDGIGVTVGFTPDGATPAAETSWGRLKSLYR
jgi:hypothetical protein